MAKEGLLPARPRIGSSGQDSVWAGTFRGFLNVLLRASSAQFGFDIVDQMLVQFNMGRINMLQTKSLTDPN